MQEMQVRSLGQEDPLEKGMATPPSILAWEIPWTVESGGPQSMGSQKRHDLVTKQKTIFSKSNQLKQFKKSLLMIGKNPVLLVNKKVFSLLFLKDYLLKYLIKEPMIVHSVFTGFSTGHNR